MVRDGIIYEDKHAEPCLGSRIFLFFKKFAVAFLLPTQGPPSPITRALSLSPSLVHVHALVDLLAVRNFDGDGVLNVY